MVDMTAWALRGYSSDEKCLVLARLLPEKVDQECYLLQPRHHRVSYLPFPQCCANSLTISNTNANAPDCPRRMWPTCSACAREPRSRGMSKVGTCRHSK